MPERILLLSGPQHFDERRPITGNIRKWLEHLDPLGIAIVSAVIKKHYPEADVCWRSISPSDKQSNDEILRIIEGVGAVFVSSRTFDISLVRPIIDQAARLGKKVVVGGYGPTFMPELFPHVTIVKGEFESVAEELMDDFGRGTLKDVYNAMKEGPFDISGSYILPDRSIFPRQSKLSERLMRHPQEWQRGCYNFCSFCSPTRMQRGVTDSEGKRRIRVRSVGSIEEEIERMGLGRGSHLFLTDLNTSLIPCEMLRELFTFLNNKGIRWYTEGTVAPLLRDLEENGRENSLLALMSAYEKGGGCYSFLYGADDLVSEKVAGSFDKRAEDLKFAIRTFRESGIPLNLSIVVGLDNHTYPDSFFEIAQALEEARPPYSFIHIATPYPGTPWGDEVRRQGRLIIDVADQSTAYNHRRVVHKPKNMTEEQLQQGYYWLLRRSSSPTGINLPIPGSPPLLGLFQTGIVWRMETFLTVLELQARGYLDQRIQRELDRGYEQWLKGH